MSDCGNQCGSCDQTCGERTEPVDLKVTLHKLSRVKKVIGVVSGKGGVGKSLVTGLLASRMQRDGAHAAVLDADITGPSIPRMFGLTRRMSGTELGLNPVRSATGVDIASMNLLLEHDTDPVVWRGPIIASVVTQFWSEVVWNNVDYMFVDMPPGTGDVPLTVFQSMAINGIVIVTSPQELVSMIVEKAMNMVRLDGLNIPVVGLVENMSYYECPDCGKKHSIFGESKVQEIARQYGIAHTARLPIDPKLATACDRGAIEAIDSPWLDDIVQAIKEL